MEKICWKGEDGLNWRAEMGILDQKPAVLSLAYEKNGTWTVLEENLVPEFYVVTSKRTKNNPQRAMALKEGEELDYQWDTYSDDPFGHPQDVKMATSSAWRPLPPPRRMAWPISITRVLPASK